MMKVRRNFLRHVFHSKIFLPLSIAIVVFAGIAGTRHLGLFQGLELSVYDRFLGFSPDRRGPAPPIVLIRIQEADIQRFGYPLSDGLLAQTLEKLLPHAPRAIGVDLFRDLASTGHERLAKIVNKDPRIVMVDKRLGQSVSAPAFLENRDQVGFADLKQDQGGIIRRGLLILWNPENPAQAYLAFSLQLALRYLQEEGITLTPDPRNPALVGLGETTLPRFRAHDGGYHGADDGGYQYLMDYGRGPLPFTAVSLSAVLDGEWDPEAIRGRVVIIGTTSPSVPDRYETPFSSLGFDPLYGVELHAHAADQLIRVALSGDTPLKVLSEYQELIGILLAIVMGSALGFATRSSVRLTFAALGGVILPVGGGYLFFLQGWWLPVAALTLAGGSAFAAAIFALFLREHRERKQIMDLFGYYVSREVAATLWRQREEFMEAGRLRPQELTITVLMSDLMGYTSALEKMDPAFVMDWINRYMGAMAQIVEAHGGIVEDYAGDGLKASFGVPVPRTRSEAISLEARQAVNCALAMGEELARVNASLRAQGLPIDRCRIGICTGPAIAGSVGSPQRMTYTTVGDTVNIAARLESFDKKGFQGELNSGFRILVSESTWQRLGPGYRAKCIGTHPLRGRDHPLTIYRIYSHGAKETAP